MYQTDQTSPRRDLSNPRAGFALAAALGVLVLLSIMVVNVFANAMASFRSGQTDLGKSRAYYAAEAGAESAMAQVALALEDAVIEDQELNTISAPDLDGFTFDEFSVVKLGDVGTEHITDGPYAGLFSLTQIVEITSEARGPDHTSSAVMITAKAQAIPIFQFGVFFEKDLEITNGPRMDFDGWVHSNGNIYLNSNNQYFGDVITTPNNLYHDRKDSHDNKTGTYMADATANYVQLNFDSRDTPDANAFRAKSDDRFDNRLKTNAYEVDSLKVPLPAGMAAETVIEPRNAGDGPLEQNAKFAWKADWYIEVDLASRTACNAHPNASFNACANPGMGNGAGSLCTSALTHTRPVGAVVPNNAQCRNIFWFTEDMWYEGRALRYVDVLEIDVGALFQWIGNNAARATSLMYLTVTSTNAAQDPAGDGTYPIVRLINADELESGITFATNFPLYVQGDYNTDVWYPSALIGDAITFQSNNWDDDDHFAATVIKPNATPTTIYAAVMAGHTGTPCDHEVAGCGATSPYGGGLENFPRFLERWTNQTLTFRGSLVSLSFSQIATGQWNGGYYSPPIRDWEFDMRFNDPVNMPPGTPVVGNVIHTAFRPIS